MQTGRPAIRRIRLAHNVESQAASRTAVRCLDDGRALPGLEGSDEPRDIDQTSVAVDRYLPRVRADVDTCDLRVNGDIHFQQLAGGFQCHVGKPAGGRHRNAEGL